MDDCYQNNRSNPNFQNTRNNQSNQNTQSNPTTPNTQTKHTFLPQHGHYRHLRVYQVSEVLYDLTYSFCHRFLSYGDRTIDQMVQAARSGKQNIAEGNQAATTSSETEIKLTNVAKASLEELLVDYEDYLRTRGLPQWDRNHPRFYPMREYARSKEIIANYKHCAESMSDEELANLCITLCHQAIYMLSRLIESQQERFTTEGGIRERMTAARLGYRTNQRTELNALIQENQALKERIRQLEELIAMKNN